MPFPLERYWYRPSLHPLTMLLLPLAGLFSFAQRLRKYCYRAGYLKVYRAPVPVIVVGNITVGGTGKTPFVIWLAALLRSQGWRPGIVSRGVGGQMQQAPRRVSVNDDPKLIGDEALLLARRSQCPLVIGIDRAAAVEMLLANTDCNIVISDDGLQRYSLARDLEIVMVDGERGLGNGWLLPAGPLRELQSRLKSVDFIVTQNGSQGYTMQLQPLELVSVQDEQKRIPIQSFTKVHAVAAIGHPQRFFNVLRGLGLDVIEHVFPDHYLYSKQDLQFNDTLPIIMTEKDAVKCAAFADDRCWYLSVLTVVSEDLGKAIFNRAASVSERI